MKRFFVGVLTVAFCFLTSGCSLVAQVNAKEINENSNFELGLLTKAEEIDLDRFQAIGMKFGGESYFDKKYGEFEDPTQIYGVPYVIYDLSGWPDSTCDWRVTGIACTDPTVELFGVSVGDSYTEFTAILKKRGFKRDTSKDMLYAEQYVKGRIEINVGIGYEGATVDTVTYFRVSVETTNLLGVTY